MSGRATMFWLSAAGIVWVLGGYPAALALLPRRPWHRDDIEPTVAIVIPAYRERRELRAKLEALASLDYPAELLQVVVVVDEDYEVARTARESLPSATVLFSEKRRGKAAGLNRGVEGSASEIVLLTDANNILAPASVRLAVRHFADPLVWAVTGRRGEEGSAYDRYEDIVRRLEIRSGSVAGMFGEFIAVRRERLPRFREDLVVDDLWLLLQLVRAGGRVVYEPGAVSQEVRLEAHAEVARRSRMSAGRVMLTGELHGLPPGFLWRLLSHKWGRLALPVLLPIAFVSCLSLSRSPLYRAMAAIQALFYGAGVLSLLGLQPPGRAGRLSSVARQFVVGNVSVGIGLVRGLRGRQHAIWKPVR